jgi:hypothetical protein
MDPSPDEDVRPSGHLVSAPDRRTILRAAGALEITGVAAGLTGASLREVPASAATSSALIAARPAASRVRSSAGANKDAFQLMLTKAPKLRIPPTGARWYLDAVTYPNTQGYADVSWPDITADHGSPAHALVSIRPEI